MLIAIVPVVPFGHCMVFTKFIRRNPQLRSHILEVLLTGIRIVRWVFQNAQRFVARHLLGEDQTGKLATPNVESKPCRQPVSFVEAGKTRFEVFLRIRFPAILALQQVNRQCLRIGHEVERLEHLHSFEITQIYFVPIYRAEWIATHRHRAITIDDIAYMPHVRPPIIILGRHHDTLGSDVAAIQDRPDAVLFCKLVQYSYERVILWNVQMRNPALNQLSWKSRISSQLITSV